MDGGPDGSMLPHGGGATGVSPVGVEVVIGAVGGGAGVVVLGRVGGAVGETERSWLS